MQQYRACVIDFLGMGIICASYITVLCVQAIPISLAFYAIPIFHILTLTCPLFFYTDLITILNAAGHNGASNQQCYKHQKDYVVSCVVEDTKDI